MFENGDLQRDLRGRSVRGGTITLVSQGIRFVLGFVSTIFLARLLTPADFGMIAMVTALLGFVWMFQDAGLAMAVVQRERINHEQVSTLFWINVALAVVMTLIVIAAAPAVAWFYEEPKLTPVTEVLALSILVLGLGMQHRALLLRQMRIGSISAISIISDFFGAGTAIWFAATYGSYWALVLRILVPMAVRSFLFWVGARWIPGPPRRETGVRPMMRFGINLTASRMLTYWVRKADNIMIGKIWGEYSLGLYTKAYSLLMLPVSQIINPISSIAIPALSRLTSQPLRFRSFYVKALRLVTTMGLFVISFTLIDADDLVLLVLGDQWLDAVPIFRALGPMAILGTFSCAAGWVFVPFGHVDRQFRFALFGVPLTIAGMAIGLRWGPIGVAIGLSLTSILKRPFMILYAYHGTPLKLVDLASALWRPSLAALVSCAAVLAWPSRLVASDLIMRLFLDGIVYSTVFCITILAAPGGRTFVHETMELVWEMRFKRR